MGQLSCENWEGDLHLLQADNDRTTPEMGYVTLCMQIYCNLLICIYIYIICVCVSFFWYISFGSQCGSKLAVLVHS